MNWEAVSAIGEIIGAAAVVATLFYLAIQIRQNNRVVEENSRQLRLSEVDATLQSFSRFRSLVADPHTAELLAKGLDEYETLSPAEKIQIGAVLDEYLFSYWSVYRRVEEGAYDEDDWEAHLKALSSVLARRGAHQWWEQRKSAYPVRFVAHLEEKFSDRAGGVV